MKIISPLFDFHVERFILPAADWSTSFIIAGNEHGHDTRMNFKQIISHIEFHADTLSKSRYTMPTLTLIVSTGFDLLTKDYAFTFWRGSSGVTVIENFLRFDYEENREGLFHISSILPEAIRQPFYIGAGIIAFLFVCWFAYRLHISKAGMYGIMFIAAGATGNIGYRIFRGYLVSFIHFYHDEFHWTIFNLADVYIDVGLSLMIIDIIRRRHELHLPQLRQYQ